MTINYASVCDGIGATHHPRQLDQHPTKGNRMNKYGKRSIVFFVILIVFYILQNTLFEWNNDAESRYGSVIDMIFVILGILVIRDQIIATVLEILKEEKGGA
ncbi:MAG: hypothetical protein JKY67_00225 [Pseudomonadales bacterium]|nr:hypothetical protein [Pseudomonadales bacterium]